VSNISCLLVFSSSSARCKRAHSPHSATMLSRGDSDTRNESRARRWTMVSLRGDASSSRSHWGDARTLRRTIVSSREDSSVPLPRRWLETCGLRWRFVDDIALCTASCVVATGEFCARCAIHGCAASSRTVRRCAGSFWKQHFRKVSRSLDISGFVKRQWSAWRE